MDDPASAVRPIEELQAELEALRKAQGDEKQQITLLNRIAKEEYRVDPDAAMAHASEALEIAERLSDPHGRAESINMRGISLWARGEYGKALECFDSSLAIWSGLGDRIGVSRVLNNIGNVNLEQGNLKEAHDNYIRSLDLKEEAGDRRGLFNSYLNLGNIHKKQGHLTKARECYDKALDICRGLGNKRDISLCFNNIGLILSRQGQLIPAREHYESALKLQEEIGDKRGMSNSCGNLGKLLEAAGEDGEALDYYLRTLQLKEESGDRKGIAMTCCNAGFMHLKLGEIEKAGDLFQRGLKIAREIGARATESHALEMFSLLSEKRGEFAEALEYCREQMRIDREIYSEEAGKEIARVQVRYETEKKRKESEIYRLKNQELQGEIMERRRVEQELSRHKDRLEELVRERTSALTRLNEELEQSFIGTVSVISKIIETRDPYTSGHQLRVAELARAIAIRLGLSPERTKAVYIASLVHDIGKINVPQEYLSKPGKLSELEWEVIKSHPSVGHDILSSIQFPWPLADMVLHHHELINGTGYPSGLKGDDIPLESRIICVADVVEAMGSHRPYRPTRGFDVVVSHLAENRGILYDSEVVGACICLINEKLFDFQAFAALPGLDQKVQTPDT